MEQTEEELLEYARKHYPVGTQYVPAHVNKGVNEVTNACYRHSKSQHEYIHVDSKWIDLNYNDCIYADGKWATIVNQVDPMLEIQKQCKEKFPIGCTFSNTEGNTYVLSEDYATYTIYQNQIWTHSGAGCLYNDGKWATLVEPDYKALQNKAWEIFKDVKEGDKYISTRGSETTAAKDAFKTPGSKEESCYIECGPGFLWEIKDGKELYGTLLPKEGEWVVSSHEIPALTISTYTGSIISHVTTDLSIPKHLLEYKESKVKPKSNLEEVKIQVKKSKTIKI